MSARQGKTKLLPAGLFLKGKKMKLFRVIIRGGCSTTSTNYHYSYVVAENSVIAYEKVRKFLDEKDLCFSSEREMESVELIAEEGNYPECRTILFL